MNLPISLYKDKIIQELKNNSVLIIQADTGSGKSTQIPKFCLELKKNLNKKIVCTQPRRIAAINIASRISEELGEEIGNTVSYKIRFHDKTSQKTHIQVVTDGILLNEFQRDKFLNKYEIVMIDEAHERTLNIDLALGFLKNILKKRADLKLIISSATIECEKFLSIFKDAKIINVEGRSYPIETIYPKFEDESLSYIEKSINIVKKICKKYSHGDILVFMPTEYDVLETVKSLKNFLRDMTVLPLFARLSAKEQSNIFKNTSLRKIIVATNVAETSITIPKIKFVVDTGFARIVSYNTHNKTNVMPISKISQSNIKQRSGRCGRVEKGVSFRLFDKKDFETRDEFSKPEILRLNLASTLLHMLSLNINNIESFPFVDPPPVKAIKDAFNTLSEIKAVSFNKKLTKDGKKMARMPLDPRLSKFLLEATKKCQTDAIAIAAALSIQDIKEIPIDKKEEAEKKHKCFANTNSDFMFFVNIWNEIKQLKTKNLIDFCRKNFLSFRKTLEFKDIYNQIKQNLIENKIFEKEISSKNIEDDLAKCMLSAFLSNIAFKNESGSFIGAQKKEFFIHPSSALFKNPPSSIVAFDLFETKKRYTRYACKIKPEWIEEIAFDKIKKKFFNPFWDDEKKEVLAFCESSFLQIVISSKKIVPFGKQNPFKAQKIFINDAIIQNKLPNSFAFMRILEKEINEAQDMEKKLRKSLIDYEAIFNFFNKKLKDVFSLSSLQLFLKNNDETNLFIKKEDFLENIPDEKEIENFPDKINIENKEFFISYNFDPKSKKDGVTVNIKKELAPILNPDSVNWLIPGLFQAKIESILRNLPKKYRILLSPIKKTVEKIHKKISSQQSLTLKKALSLFIEEEYKIKINEAEFDEEKIPDFLKIRFSIKDEKNKEIAASRKKEILKKHFKSKDQIIEKIKKEYEQKFNKDDDFNIEEEFLVEKEDFSKIFFPALFFEKDTFSIKLFEYKKEAQISQKEAILALFSIFFLKEIKSIKKDLKISLKTEKISLYFGGSKDLKKKIIDAFLKSCFYLELRRRKDFNEKVKNIKIYIEAEKFIEKTTRLLDSFSDFIEKIETLKNQKGANPFLNEYLTKQENKLKELICIDFLNKFNIKDFSDLERFIKAAQIRAERAFINLEKDRKKEKEILIFENLYKKISQNTEDDDKEKLKEKLFAIEEYKVKIFAPELSNKKLGVSKLLKIIQEN